jgi:hypothetical protein
VIFDSDDLCEGNDRMDLLQLLKDANPAFRMTAFAIPTKCPDSYLESIPDWIEVVPHGWEHGDPGSDGGECRDWTYDDMMRVICAIEDGNDRWNHGFKAPGWIISDDCYEALADMDWWVADQAYNDNRRPDDVRKHILGGDDHVHTHIQNVCGNGLQETWGTLLERIASADRFEFVSEVAS